MIKLSSLSFSNIDNFSVNFIFFIDWVCCCEILLSINSSADSSVVTIVTFSNNETLWSVEMICELNLEFISIFSKLVSIFWSFTPNTEISVIENKDENNIPIKNNDSFFKLFQLQDLKNYFSIFEKIISYDKKNILYDKNNMI